MATEALHAYWDGFYASRAAGAVPGDPSPFAGWVDDRVPAGVTVAEFGFGTARDALHFAQGGHPVLGFDFAESAVERARALAAEHALPATFEGLDLYDAQAVSVVAEQLGRVDGLVVYGRFLIHSLEDEGRGNLLDLASKSLAHGGELLLEFRTGQDATARHVFGDDHFRIYLDPQVVIDEIVARGGRITHVEAGHGLAVYRTEDPHVARLAARWA